MPPIVHRIMCHTCKGSGVVWAPRMAVQYGSTESFSLMAPTTCRDCRGGGWFEIRESGPAADRSGDVPPPAAG